MARAVQEMRDEVQALRHDVDKFRKRLESASMEGRPKESRAVIEKNDQSTAEQPRIESYSFVLRQKKPLLRSRFDLPTSDEILKVLAQSNRQKSTLFSESEIKNVKAIVELIDDSVNEPRYYPLVGQASLRRVQYKCELFYEKTFRCNWPIPFKYTGQLASVVYIDHDHLIRCAAIDRAH